MLAFDEVSRIIIRFEYVGINVGIIDKDNHITAAKIAEDLDMSARQIERIMADLKAKGIIRRIGANRTDIGRLWAKKYLYHSERFASTH